VSIGLDGSQLPPEEAKRPRDRRLWWWIITLLVALPSILALVVVLLNIYRSQQALTWDKLSAAKERWNQAGIKNYDITVKTSGHTHGLYRVQVRDDRVTKAAFNDLPMGELIKGYPWTVPGLFEVLQQDLEWDDRPDSPGSHTEVQFDPADGHLVRYFRTHPGLRVTIEVELEKK
jgi:hypothetical protein